MLVSSAKSTGGFILEIKSTAQNEPIKPMAPPINDSTKVSNKSCRISNPLPAPMASRTAISLRLSDACANSRLARFTHTTTSKSKHATAIRMVENPITPPRRKSPAQPGSTSFSCQPFVHFGPLFGQLRHHRVQVGFCRHGQQLRQA